MAPRFSFVPARWLLPESPLSAPDRLTLAVLGMWANRDTGQCFPKIATIVACTKLSERAVFDSIKNLARAGALRVERRYTDTGKQLSNLYTVVGYDLPAGVQGMQGTGAPDAGIGVHNSSTNVVTTNPPLDVGGNGEPALSCGHCDFTVGFVPGTTRRFVQHESDCPSRLRLAK